jgi:hypothetical protein
VPATVKNFGITVAFQFAISDRSAGACGASDLDHTILRPGSFTKATRSAIEFHWWWQAVPGHDVPRIRLSDLKVTLALSPSRYTQSSLGVSP